MKIIHTGDWHLGQRLYRFDRTDEEAHFFGQLADAVGRERPDALVISGDIFDTGVPGNDIARHFTESLLEVVARCPSMETVVIAGNHDSYSRLVVDEALWRHHRVRVFGTPAETAEGKADFSKNVVQIGDKGYVAAVPYCFSRNFPIVDGKEDGDREKNYFAGLADYVSGIANGKPAVLMAHLAVKGDLDLRGHDQLLVIGGEECVGASELGDAYDYIALGHIHCPQWIKGGRKLARYCGTPRPIHFDETYGHGVDVVTVESGADPIVETVTFAPLRPLVTIGGKKGKPFDDALAELKVAELAPESYVRLNVSMTADALLGADWLENTRKACDEKGLRFCLINPIREEPQAIAAAAPRKSLTTAELKNLSKDKVLSILSSRHALTERQCDLLKSLIEEVVK